VNAILSGADGMRESLSIAIGPRLNRLSKRDRAAVYDVVVEFTLAGARAKAQRDTAALRDEADQVRLLAKELALENASLREQAAAVRKAHQQAEERAQYWRAQFTEEAARSIKLAMELAHRKPWWMWWR
jgi:hypothetical protein